MLNKFFIRFFDILFAFFSAVFFLPLFILISIAIVFDSRGGILFFQNRIGKKGREFRLIKFRTMSINSEKKGFITIGSSDKRITKVGKFLRKYKLDELPQLFNIILGQMSIVGPRPEVKKYVDLYTIEQRKVLDVLPGLTDFASIKYSNENEILEKVDNPEQFYIDLILPDKIKLNQLYISDYSLKNYFKIIIITICKVFHRNN